MRLSVALMRHPASLRLSITSSRTVSSLATTEVYGRVADSRRHLLISSALHLAVGYWTGQRGALQGALPQHLCANAGDARVGHRAELLSRLSLTAAQLLRILEPVLPSRVSHTFPEKQSGRLSR